MLVNEIYIGNMVQGKYGSVSYKTKQNRPRPRDEWYIVEGTHEAIIDRELWNRVQAMIPNGQSPVTQERLDYLRERYTARAADTRSAPQKAACAISAMPKPAHLEKRLHRRVYFGRTG